MNDVELQRLERCKRCSKSTEAEDFQGGTELYCPLHGYPCDMIIQCLDNHKYCEYCGTRMIKEKETE